MIEINKLREESMSAIVCWCADRDEDFLRQWAGAGYTYPLTEEQICRRAAEGAEIFEVLVDGEMSATIEIINRNEQDNSALIGRFVLNPGITGRGTGTQIMKAFLDYCREEWGLAKAILYVFDFNTAAHRCYQKCGFAETGREDRPNGWKAVRMEKIL